MNKILWPLVRFLLYVGLSLALLYFVGFNMAQSTAIVGVIIIVAGSMANAASGR